MNNINVLGRLSANPEMRQAASGNKFCYINIAVQKDKEHTDFIDITCFGKLAEFVCTYFTRGKYIGISGHIDTSTFERNGEKIYSQKLVADKVYFAGYTKESALPQESAGYFIAATLPETDLPF